MSIVKKLLFMVLIQGIFLCAGMQTFAATYSATPEQITCTPYGDLKTQVGFAWVTNTDTSTTNLSTIAQLIVKNSGVAFGSGLNYTGTTGLVSTSFRWHKVVAGGLQPGTKYQYRVGNGSTWSNTGEFETAPSEAASAFTFVNVNDPQATTQTDYATAAAAFARATAKFPDYKFVLHAGDHVDDGGNDDQWQDFFKTAQTTLSKSVFASATGNHDAMSGNHFAERFNYLMPTDSITTSGMYYSFDYANTHFTVINSQANADDNQDDWVQYDMVKNAKRWNVVLIHNPLYTNADHYDETNTRNAWNAILNDQLQVDLIWGGHDHIYNRTYPMLNNTRVTTNTTLTNTVVNGIPVGTLLVNPSGTLNLLNGACGTKFYKQKSVFDYIAYTAQPLLAMYAGVTISENEIINSCYYTDGTSDTLIETTGIRKTTAPPSAPIGVKKSFASNTMTISWSMPANSDARGFVIYDENNNMSPTNYTLFVNDPATRSAKIRMTSTIYNGSNFVVKALGQHTFSNVGTTEKGITQIAYTNTASTTAGTAPTLPTAATVTYSDSTQESAQIVWDSVPSSVYGVAGVYTVNGTVLNQAVTLTLTVTQALPNLSFGTVLTASGGTEVTALTGTSQTLYIPVTNNTTANISMKWLVATYDTAGRLLTLKSATNAVLVQAGKTSNITITGTNTINTTNAQKLKIFLWNPAIQNVLPYGPAKVIAR